jgi:hypothetical protein
MSVAANRQLYFEPEEMDRLNRVRNALGYEEDGRWHTPTYAELVRFLVMVGIDEFEGIARAVATRRP